MAIQFVVSTLLVRFFRLAVRSLDGQQLVLRARLQATTATDALAERIVLFLCLDALLWHTAHVVVIVDGNPALEFFQSSKQPVSRLAGMIPRNSV